MPTYYELTDGDGAVAGLVRHSDDPMTGTGRMDAYVRGGWVQVHTGPNLMDDREVTAAEAADIERELDRRRAAKAAEAAEAVDTGQLVRSDSPVITSAEASIARAYKELGYDEVESMGAEVGMGLAARHSRFWPFSPDVQVLWDSMVTSEALLRATFKHAEPGSWKPETPNEG